MAEEIKTFRPYRYIIVDEFNQAIAETLTRFTAEFCVEHMNANTTHPTWKHGTYRIVDKEDYRLSWIKK